MPASNWSLVPNWVKLEAENEARLTEPYINHAGRDRDEVIADLYRGYIGEITYHDLNRTLGWWRAQRIILQGKSSDNGSDAPNGDNIKTIPKDGRFVVVNDDRAARYVVFEYDVLLGIRLLGRFFKKDISNITIHDGTMKRGVYVEQIR